ncbi:hypothetical protein EVAR_100470_1 [Eumeta japonica]|uniref:Uncharacterized protein n=1 Tax=Eumeta variegata TaxID=151549 RepID=A0A4C1SFJ1_EUMVA|nr:hypothetical protein EVAR_100470_1 [Eumeta japonica]
MTHTITLKSYLQRITGECQALATTTVVDESYLIMPEGLRDKITLQSAPIALISEENRIHLRSLQRAKEHMSELRNDNWPNLTIYRHSTRRTGNCSEIRYSRDDALSRETIFRPPLMTTKRQRGSSRQPPEPEPPASEPMH